MFDSQGTGIKCVYFSKCTEEQISHTQMWESCRLVACNNGGKDSGVSKTPLQTGMTSAKQLSLVTSLQGHICNSCKAHVGQPQKSCSSKVLSRLLELWGAGPFTGK